MTESKAFCGLASTPRLHPIELAGKFLPILNASEEITRVCVCKCVCVCVYLSELCKRRWEVGSGGR